jgi:hypothetical protein
VRGAIWGLMVLATAALVVVLWRVRWQRAFLGLAATFAALLIAVWVVLWGLLTTDETGAGEAFDCWPDCSLYQDVIAVGLVGLPIMLVVLIVALVAIAALRRIDRFR